MSGWRDIRLLFQWLSIIVHSCWCYSHGIEAMADCIGGPNLSPSLYLSPWPCDLTTPSHFETGLDHVICLGLYTKQEVTVCSSEFRPREIMRVSAWPLVLRLHFTVMRTWLGHPDGPKRRMRDVGNRVIPKHAWVSPSNGPPIQPKAADLQKTLQNSWKMMVVLSFRTLKWFMKQQYLVHTGVPCLEIPLICSLGI